MKKIASIAALALFTVGFTSCKKDYTCTCKDKDGKQTGLTATYPKVKKSDAKKACDLLHTAQSSSGGSCSL